MRKQNWFAQSRGENLEMNTQQDEKRKALFSLASLAVGLKQTNHEGRTATLHNAIAHNVTNIECIRECLRLKILGGTPKPQLPTSRIFSERLHFSAGEPGDH